MAHDGLQEKTEKIIKLFMVKFFFVLKLYMSWVAYAIVSKVNV